MDKAVFTQYADALARIKYLRESVHKAERKLEKIEQKGYYVTDSVSRGKKGKKSLGTIKISGFPYPEQLHLKSLLNTRKERLQQEEQNLLEKTIEVEECIEKIEEIEIRNLFSLYYIEGLNWIQVAHRMNQLYGSRKNPYTSESCRKKHERFFEKK